MTGFEAEDQARQEASDRQEKLLRDYKERGAKIADELTADLRRKGVLSDGDQVVFEVERP